MQHAMITITLHSLNTLVVQQQWNQQGKKIIEVDLQNTLEDGWWKEKHGFQFAEFFVQARDTTDSKHQGDQQTWSTEQLFCQRIQIKELPFCPLQEAKQVLFFNSWKVLLILWKMRDSNQSTIQTYCFQIQKQQKLGKSIFTTITCRWHSCILSIPDRIFLFIKPVSGVQSSAPTFNPCRAATFLSSLFCWHFCIWSRKKAHILAIAHTHCLYHCSSYALII